jgi:hypothetical protein
VERLVLRKVVLLGAPLALAILEIFHPERPSSASGAVEQGVWFMWFHYLHPGSPHRAHRRSRLPAY